MDEITAVKSQSSNLLGAQAQLSRSRAQNSSGSTPHAIASISRSGQAVVEYILLLAIITSIYSLLLNKLSSSNAMAAMKKPFTKEFAYTYRYGDAKARGQDDGGPINIPQHHDLEKNFRIFINPPINE
jgi:hypothetical protein